MLYAASILSIIMVLAAIWVVLTPNLLQAIIIFALVSLVASALFLFMQAPDVAITEAAIGAGMSTAIFIFSYKRIYKTK
ncbi:MAG: hydrogenase subunit MbhD domain-containing protein [Clostridiaceae bacterium]